MRVLHCCGGAQSRASSAKRLLRRGRGFPTRHETVFNEALEEWAGLSLTERYYRYSKHFLFILAFHFLLLCIMIIIIYITLFILTLPTFFSVSERSFSFLLKVLNYYYYFIYLLRNIIHKVSLLPDRYHWSYYDNAWYLANKKM